MDAYQSSLALQKLRWAQQANQPLRLAFLDVDGTWTGTPDEQQAVRTLLETQGYVITQVTNRAPDLCLSQRVPEARQSELAGLLDPDIVAANFATALLIRQTNGNYEPDQAYHRRLPRSALDWQADVERLLNSLPLPDPLTGIHYRFLPVFRLEVEGRTRAAAGQLVDRLKHAPSTALHLARDGRSVIITPAHASKEDAVDHILASLLRHLNCSPRDLHVLLAGNAVADAAMGLTSGQGTDAVFLIPGGSALANELDVTKYEKSGTLPAGVYRVRKPARQIIVGDEAFPGTVGPQTLRAWLER